MRKVALLLFASGVVGILVGLCFTALSMVRDFNSVSDGGGLNQAAVAQETSVTLLVTMAGVTVAGAGIVLWLLWLSSRKMSNRGT